MKVDEHRPGRCDNHLYRIKKTRGSVSLLFPARGHSPTYPLQLLFRSLLLFQISVLTKDKVLSS